MKVKTNEVFVNLIISNSVAKYKVEYIEEYKDVYKKVLKEFRREDLPILYNINIGHAYPTGIFH